MQSIALKWATCLHSADGMHFEMHHCNDAQLFSMEAACMCRGPINCSKRNVYWVQILTFYDLRGKNKWAFVGYEAIFIVVFFILAWLALCLVKHQKR